jgi:hypothetical protein
MLMRKIIKLTLITTSLFASAANALPTDITFSNNTPLDLATSISGIPGNGVAANVSRAVSFSIVSFGCYVTGNMNNCPIEFSDKATGEHVATVHMNVETATLNQAPIFYGNYANEYEVTGWESSPVTHITINKKA